MTAARQAADRTPARMRQAAAPGDRSTAHRAPPNSHRPRVIDRMTAMPAVQLSFIANLPEFDLRQVQDIKYILDTLARRREIANLSFDRASAGKPLRRRGVAVSTRDFACAVRCWRWPMLLGAIGRCPGSSLSGLAVPAIEGPGDRGRERLDRPLDRGNRHHKTERRKASRAGGAPGRTPHPDRRCAETDCGLCDGDERGKAGKGDDAFRQRCIRRSTPSATK